MKLLDSDDNGSRCNVHLLFEMLITLSHGMETLDESEMVPSPAASAGLMIPVRFYFASGPEA
jgi:hypothetical protein